ncbi:putative chitinase 10 [Andrena cerasifolii]|uniref:putative chitinase 10 n=1 Tax=Andrena cerasifolii TaxID=2819439 RepID=UPI0040377B7C
MKCVCLMILFVTVVVTTIVKDTSVPPCPIDNCVNQTNIAHESDCTKYYSCFCGIGHLMICPEFKKGYRLHFDPKQQVCDWPWNVNCTLKLD